MLTLLWSHRVDDGLNILERFVADFHVLDSFSYARNHGCKILDVTHLLDLLDLTKEVIEIKLIFLDFLFQAFCLFHVKLLLGALYEGDNVTHAEDSVSHTFRMEYVECFHLLACTDEFDRFRNNGTDTESCTTM